ncbi:MAG: YtxH domain-containing protein [Bacteroidota bacterium]
MKNKTGLSFILGAFIGAGIAWLFTSKEGKELVEKAKGKANDLAGEIKKQLASLQQEKTEENG